MNAQQVLATLEEMGTAQNRKVYTRHGVTGPMYGVSYGDQGKLKKKLKIDHELAQELWASGNHDARVLATMLADPARLTWAQIESWAGGLDNYVLTDALSTLCGKSRLKAEIIEKWSDCGNEWKEQLAWSMVAFQALSSSKLPDDYFIEQLEAIATEIHGRLNRVRYTMNNALIAIGGRNQQLRERAIEVAGRIGVVDVDHGETGCKTPDAAPYIENMWKRKLQKQRKTS